MAQGGPPYLSPNAPNRVMSTLPGFEGRPALRAVRLEEGERIKVDGALDEAAWGRATPAGDFIQQDPGNGRPATERTEVRILFDKHSLYMGVKCFDSEPTKLKRNQMVRDGFLPADDRFMWTIDPLLNGVNGYFFETNPSGLMGDALIIGASNFGGNNVRGWDGIWYERVTRTGEGWFIEVEIPFQTLAFDAKAPAWGINFQRTVKRKNEESVWTGWNRNQNLQRMTNAGLLEGISEVTQGKGLAIQPYLIGKFQEAPPGTNNPFAVVAPNLRGSFGGDAIYSITPQLKATFTVNTDFAETEVDARQVNLTRFNVFFPERRTFFLEGSNFLSFGREPDSVVMPYFSRNIGLNVDGTTQRVNFGAKVTGQIGAYDLGFLQVETANNGDKAGENFSVFRGRRRFLTQSYVGAIFTRRAARGNLPEGRALSDGSTDDRYTTGADFSLATSRFRGNQNLELSGFYLWNSVNPLGTPLPVNGAGQAAYGLRLEFPNDRWSGRMAFREIQQNWNPAVGFIQRVNVRHYSPSVTFAPRPRNNRLVRRYVYSATLDMYTDLRNVTRTRTLDLNVFQMELQSGDTIQAHILPSYESPESNFQISKGIVIKQNSAYSFTRGYVQVNTNNRRFLAATAKYEMGDFYSENRKQAFLSLYMRPRPGVYVQADYEWNKVQLAEGRFSTNLYRAVVNTQFSPFISLANVVQYDNISRQMGWQSRFRWIVKPGNDIYVVYSRNWMSDPLVGLQTLSQNAASKIVYTRQF